jgi:hypothetical protein
MVGRGVLLVPFSFSFVVSSSVKLRNTVLICQDTYLGMKSERKRRMWKTDNQPVSSSSWAGNYAHRQNSREKQGFLVFQDVHAWPWPSHCLTLLTCEQETWYGEVSGVLASDGNGILWSDCGRCQEDPTSTEVLGNSTLARAADWNDVPCLAWSRYTQGRIMDVSNNTHRPLHLLQKAKSLLLALSASASEWTS